jgi:biopolymer transport protein ExbD
MRLPKREPRRGATENMIPLINIVFLILIFFLVASTLRGFDPGGLTLATADAEAGADQGPNVLLAFADGRIDLAGQSVAEGALAARLEAFARKNPDAPLLIAPDRTLPADRLVEIAQAARAAGIGDVKLIVRKDVSADTAGP